MLKLPYPMSMCFGLLGDDAVIGVGRYRGSTDERCMNTVLLYVLVILYPE